MTDREYELVNITNADRPHPGAFVFHRIDFDDAYTVCNRMPDSAADVVPRWLAERAGGRLCRHCIATEKARGY